LVVVCSVIVDKIDKNNDGFVTQEELKDWIKFTQTRYIMNDVHSQWDNHKNLENEKLSWALYRKDTYGFMSGKVRSDGVLDYRFTIDFIIFSR